MGRDEGRRSQGGVLLGREAISLSASTRPQGSAID